jgi:hypothetical protein
MLLNSRRATPPWNPRLPLRRGYPVLQPCNGAIRVVALQDVPKGDVFLEKVVDGRLHRRVRIWMMVCAGFV